MKGKDRDREREKIGKGTLNREGKVGGQSWGCIR